MRPLFTAPLISGETHVLLGIMQTHPAPMLTELAALCGYDFVILDCEHGWFSDADLLEALRIVAATRTAIIVRPLGHDSHVIGRLLDMGVDGLLIPKVETAEQAQAIALACEYPPKGTRGFGAPSHRVTRYGLDLDGHMKETRANQSLFVIIESALGVANVDGIAAVEGIDGVVVGPSDLSADLGSLGDIGSAAYTQSLERVERSLQGQGKLLGTASPPNAALDTLVCRGYQLLIVSGDAGLIRDAMTSQLAKAKSCLARC